FSIRCSRRGEAQTDSPGIRTGFSRSAQGCEARATLGDRSQNMPSRNAVVAQPSRARLRFLRADHPPDGQPLVSRRLLLEEFPGGFVRLELFFIRCGQPAWRVFK